MVRRIFLILLACVFLASSSVAYADAIYEPQNDFTKKHLSDLVELKRSFTANGKDGTVAVKAKPGAKLNTTSIKNGSVIFIQYSCLYGGEFWGYAENAGDSRQYSGWVKLDQMLVNYDHITFAEEHQNEFYAYEGAYSEITDPWPCVTWPWPGAGNMQSEMTVNPVIFSISHAYLDKEGREWGFISDYKRSRGLWICLSDPLNLDIPTFNPAPEPYPWVSVTTHVDLKGKFAIVDIIIALVAVVVVGTAVLIRVFWKPKTTSGDSHHFS